MGTLIIGRRDILELIQREGLNGLMDELIKRLTSAVLGFSSANYEVPQRGGFNYQHPFSGLLEWMPLLEKEKGITIKTVGYHPANPDDCNLPTILSTINCFDFSGHLLGIVDGTFLTALRTGAASAIASRILASPASRTLGIIGCGAQGVSQVHGLSRGFDFSSILFCDRDDRAEETFPERCAPFLQTQEMFQRSSVSDVVSEADILCTATSVEAGQGPVFPELPLQPGLHINAVGSDFPGKTEIPCAVLKRALVCPDFLEQAVREGECQQLRPNEIGPDFANLVRQAGKFTAAREQLTVFDSTGWALEDHVAGGMILDYARQHRLGHVVEIESISDDPRDPYGFALSGDSGARSMASAKSAPASTSLAI